MSIGHLPIAAAPNADDGGIIELGGSTSKRTHKPQRGPVRLIATRSNERCRA